MYKNVSELHNAATEQGIELHQVILENEKRLSSLTEEQVFEKLKERYKVMLNSAGKALEKSLPTVGSLIEGHAKDQYKYSKESNSLCGPFLNLVMARALSCSEANASMGKICAAPTAGASGILPAVLISLSERFNCTERQTLEALLLAAGIGAIITKNATVSGAEGGCQAECGVAAAMASAAAVQLSGGSTQMMLDACSLSLMNVMGLICDPVAGLVQVPCAQRNASQALNALLSADLAMAGMVSIIPLDEVIDAMYRVGKMLPPQLKETSQGGIASTPTAKAIYNRIFRENTYD
ncbi:MAG: L-serine ammonia-lyase, iron-sulfur-dependent, subunit alpha [Vallitaleaceae bacterium]|nr:L-serine ammonia-lyase, iron-sulfur-dependent, subunit alpha [Vallitaleaceae bacterium]